MITLPTTVISPLILADPFTSSLAPGAVVQIPTLPVSQIVSLESLNVAEPAHIAGQFKM